MPIGSRLRHRHVWPCVSHRHYLPPIYPKLKRSPDRQVHRSWREICTREPRELPLLPFIYRDP